MKNRYLYLLTLCAVFSLPTFAKKEACFDTPVSMYCENEYRENYSLNGYFRIKGRSYEFSTRRAFGLSWCEETKVKISDIMSLGEFCIQFEEDLMEPELTVNSVDGDVLKWSYFQ